ncbi:hypothetical protein DL95DRAFT_69478 [Leptodontidium sp. 2 PMI_412]|nr:hypothetical protein DL95DRAFT_69478 [Leptodontidium sp. 2 PMI_412]
MPYYGTQGRSITDQPISHPTPTHFRLKTDSIPIAMNPLQHNYPMLPPPDLHSHSISLTFPSPGSLLQGTRSPSPLARTHMQTPPFPSPEIQLLTSQKHTENGLVHPLLSLRLTRNVRTIRVQIRWLQVPPPPLLQILPHFLTCLPTLTSAVAS